MTTTSWTGAPPVPLEPLASLEVDRAADGPVLAACLVAAVGADLALRTGGPGLAAAAVPAAVGASLIATRRFPNPQARALLAAAPVLTAFLALRTNEATVAADVLAAAVLLALAAGLARGGSVLDLTFPAVAGRLALTVTHGLLAPGFISRPIGRLARSRPQARAMARGVAVGVPVVAAVAALLASADAVFASLLRLPDPRDMAIHVALLGLGGLVAAAVLRHASARMPALPLGPAPALGRLEARIVLGGLCGVFAAFAAAQVAAATGAADRILAGEGLTYAQYARQGFFQLLAAAGLTAVVLLCVRAGGLDGDQVGRALAIVAVGLTEVVVAVAVHRLSLYEDAYGLTLLRLAAVGAAVWIGLVFLLIGIAVAGAGAGRSWLPGAIGAAALAGLLAWNLADPAALVARRDLDRAQVDPAYLAALGDDAVPAIAARVDRLDPTTRRVVVVAVCARAPQPRNGPLAWNRAASRAAAARADLGC
jgi:hypothetical protein